MVSMSKSRKPGTSSRTKCCILLLVALGCAINLLLSRSNDSEYLLTSLKSLRELNTVEQVVKNEVVQEDVVQVVKEAVEEKNAVEEIIPSPVVERETVEKKQETDVAAAVEKKQDTAVTANVDNTLETVPADEPKDSDPADQETQIPVSFASNNNTTTNPKLESVSDMNSMTMIAPDKPKQNMMMMNNKKKNKDAKDVDTKPKAPYVSIDDLHLPPDNSTHFRGVQARPFDRWPKSWQLPCDPQNYTEALGTWSKTETGIVFVSPFKTGSTTASGVNIRMAKAIAEGMGHEMCKVRYYHGHASNIIPKPNKKMSFIWTVIREPTKRAISHYFYGLTNSVDQPTDENFRKFCTKSRTRSSFVTNHYVSRLPLSVGGTPDNNKTALAMAQEVLREYNFIAITERMDESLVAMATLLGIPVSHVLFLKANKSKGEFSRHSSKEQCNYIMPSFVSPGMEQFFKTKEWQTLTFWDLALYTAANRSLDMTIQALGDDYTRNMEIFKRAQERARQECTPRTIFPCNEAGEFRNETDCMFLDSGCGNDCLDEIAVEFKDETGYEIPAKLIPVSEHMAAAKKVAEAKKIADAKEAAKAKMNNMTLPIYMNTTRKEQKA